MFGVALIAQGRGEAPGLMIDGQVVDRDSWGVSPLNTRPFPTPAVKAPWNLPTGLLGSAETTGLIRLLLINVFASLLSACGKAEQPGEQAFSAQSSESTAQAVTLGGEELFVIACQGCHNISPGAAHRVGPNLCDIVGQATA